MAEPAPSAEVLPVRALDPPADHILVRQRFVGFRCSSEAIHRVCSAGRPVVDSNLGSQASSKAGQSIRAASLTSSTRNRCCLAAFWCRFGPIGDLGAVCQGARAIGPQA
jgi:hypothetical protein